MFQATAQHMKTLWDCFSNSRKNTRAVIFITCSGRWQ